MMFHIYSDGFNTWILMGFLEMLIGLAAVGIIIYLIVRLTSRPHMSHHADMHFREPRALDILKERYARGEIDSETYQRMKKELSEH